MAVVVMPRPFKHHVFKEMGKSRPANLFVLGTHVVPDVDCHQGDGVVLVKDDVEAVGEGELLKRDRNHDLVL